MTEITNTTETPASDTASALAFLAALIGAPLAVGAIGLLLRLVAGDLGVITLGSVPFAVPSYLLIGAPFFLHAAGAGRRSAPLYAGLGFLANLAATPLMALVSLSAGERAQEAYDFARFVGGFGLVFAPIYGLSFGLIFRALLRRPPGPAMVWSARSSRLLRLFLAQALIAYALAGVAFWSEGRDGWTAFEQIAAWRGALTGAIAQSVLAAPVFMGVRLAGPRSAAAYALAGAAVEPLAAMARAQGGVEAIYQITPLSLAITVGAMLALRLLAGAPPAREAAP